MRTIDVGITSPETFAPSNDGDGNSNRAVEADASLLASISNRARAARDILASLSITGIALSLITAPMMFNRVAPYDDEGFFLVANRQLLDGRSLYGEVSSAYGPFYHFFTTTVYRLIGQEPNLTNARLIVLLYTALSALLFAAAAWRLTRSMALTMLCQITTFGVLIQKAGAQPLHPGSLVVLLLAVLSLVLASYSIAPGRWHMTMAGSTVTALALCKINVGVAAAAALAIAMIVGNTAVPRWLRTLTSVAAVVLPFAMTAQRQTDVAIGSMSVALALAIGAVLVALHSDTTRIAMREFAFAALGGVGVVAGCVLWLVVTGTQLSRVPTGILFGPLRQVDVLFGAPTFELSWFAVVVTIACVIAALARARNVDLDWRAHRYAPLALVAVGSWIIGRALPEPIRHRHFADWLPLIGAIPALAYVSGLADFRRNALRFLTPLAVLQVLHAYPVAGAQTAWATAALFVPAVVAISAGADRLGAWRAIGRRTQVAVAVIAGVVALTVAAGSPVKVWRDYLDQQPLGLPGTSLVRVTPGQAQTYRALTHGIVSRCDTFYAAPALNSFYLFTGLEPPSGRLRNWPGSLPREDQLDLARRLRAASDSGSRVCIVRVVSRQKEWLASSYGSGPLGAVVARYQRVVFRIGDYSVAVAGRPNQPAVSAGTPQARPAPSDARGK